MPNVNQYDPLARINEKFQAALNNYKNQELENARIKFKEVITEFRTVRTRHNIRSNVSNYSLADFYLMAGKSCYDLANTNTNTNHAGLSSQQLLLEAADNFEKGYDYDPYKQMKYLYCCIDSLDAIHRQKKHVPEVYEKAKSCFKKVSKIPNIDLNQQADKDTVIDAFMRKTFFRIFAEMAFHEGDYLTARDAALFSNRVLIPEQKRQILYNDPQLGINGEKDLNLACANCDIFIGASLLLYIKEVGDISSKDKNVKIAVAEKSLLNAKEHIKGAERGSKLVVYNKLAMLYDEPIFGKTDKLKAFNYYWTSAKETRDSYALHQVGVRYYYGIGTDKNFKQAVRCFVEGTKNGIEHSKIMLAMCLINGDGCPSRPYKAFTWLKTCQPGPVRDNALAMSIINCALYEVYPQNYTTDDIISLLQQSSEVMPGPLVTLGQLYHEGFGNIPQSYTQAEFYYQQALLAGSDMAQTRLLSLYNDMLRSNQYQAHKKMEIQQAAKDLLHKLYSIQLDGHQQSLDEIVDELNIKRRNFCVAVNQDILEQANNPVKPEVKIRELLEKHYELMNSVNVATRLLKIGQFSDQIKFDGSGFFAELRDSGMSTNLDKLLTKCEEFIDNGQMGIWGLSNVITGLSKLYQHYYDDRFAKLIDKSLTVIHQQQSDMNLLSLKSILAASINWPMDASQNLITDIFAIIKDTEELQKQEQAETDKANLLYNLVVLDNYLRSQKHDQHTKPLQVDWSYWFQHTYEMLMAPSKLTNSQYSQYSMAYLYMSHYLASSIAHLKTDEKHAFTEQLCEQLNQKPLESPNPSTLQKNVEKCIRDKLKFKVESEKVINGLPVDIYLPDHHAIVQVNGPKHYIYKDKGQNRQLSMKDRFHEAIVQIPASKSKTVESDYKIIHIDYQQFNKHDKTHVETELTKAGLLKNKVTELGVFRHKNDDQQQADQKPGWAPKYG